MKGKFLKVLCLVGVLAFEIPVSGYCYNTGYVIGKGARKSVAKEGYLENETKKAKKSNL